ncbi:MAG: cytochrome D1 domain-containing protein [Gammaproteobacteria bacterium]
MNDAPTRGWSRRRFAGAALGAALGAGRPRPAPAAPGDAAARTAPHLVVVADAAFACSVDARALRLRHRVPIAAAMVGATDPSGARFALGGGDGALALLDACTGRWLARAALLGRIGALAWSGDAQHLIAADADAPALVIVDDRLQLLRRYAVADLAKRLPSRVAAVAAHAARRSFVVALRDLPELWEISLDPQAEPIYDGLVHDFRMGEAIPSAGFLGVRRSPLAAPLADPFVDPLRPQVLARTRGADGGDVVLTHNLDIRRAIAAVALADAPRPGAGAVVAHRGDRALLLPHRDAARWSLVGLRRGDLLGSVPAPSRDGTLHAPPGSPWVWCVAADGERRVVVHRVDAQRLEPAGSDTFDGAAIGGLRFDATGTFAALALRTPAPQLVVWNVASGALHGRVALDGTPTAGDCG